VNITAAVNSGGTRLARGSPHGLLTLRNVEAQTDH